MLIAYSLELAPSSTCYTEERKNMREVRKRTCLLYSCVKAKGGGGGLGANKDNI
jgi:hypothetical protein